MQVCKFGYKNDIDSFFAKELRVFFLFIPVYLLNHLLD